MAEKVEIKFYKINNITQATTKNSLFAVKADSGNSFKLYVTDLDGNLIPLFTSSGGGITNLTSTDSSILITGSVVKDLKISTALKNLISSALQSGDFISTLVNDSGYLTLADLPIFNPSDYDLEDFTNTSTDPFVRQSEVGTGETNLAYIASPTQGTVTSDTGTDATIPLADNVNAGLLSSAEKNKIATAIQSSEWFDWSGNSVITGWSSFVFKKINCKLIDDCLFVNYNISGTSNAGTAKFTLPFVNKEPTTKFDSSGYNANAGVPLTTPARVQVPIEVNEVEILRDLAGASYTASGIKHVSGGFFMSVYKTSVFNKGIGGNNTSDVIARLADINSLKANLAIVMIGTNDWRIPITGSRRTPTQYKTNLTTIVNSLQANGSQVLLLQFPPIVGAESDYVCPFFGQPSGCDSNATAIPFREKIVEVVSEKSTLYLDINQDFLDIGQPTNLSTSYMQNFANRGYTDGVHPQPIGANFIAQKIADYLNANNLSYDRIVCIGDSITAGDGLTGLNTATGQTYPAQLKNILNS